MHYPAEWHNPAGTAAAETWPADHGMRHSLSCLALTCCLAAACTPSHTPRQPARATFAKVEYDFGVVDQSSSIAYDYVVRNDGGADLVIDRVRGGCGCTASASSTVIQPAQIATIHAQCAAAYASGDVRRTITVYSNDPQHPVRALTLKGQVRSAITVVPARIYVGHVRAGETIARELRVSGVQAPAAVTTGGIVDASWATDDRMSAARTIRLRVRADAPPGQFTTTLRLPTGDAARREHVVPVVGIVDPPNA